MIGRFDAVIDQPLPKLHEVVAADLDILFGSELDGHGRFIEDRGGGVAIIFNLVIQTA